MWLLLLVAGWEWPKKGDGREYRIIEQLCANTRCLGGGQPKKSESKKGVENVATKCREKRNERAKSYWGMKDQQKQTLETATAENAQ